jgi:HK97 gp10 family phage protein
MSIRVDFDASQIDALADDLEQAGPRAVERVKTVMSKTMHNVVADAQNLVPVDTGALKGSIGPDLDGDGLGFIVGATMSYAAHVEYGTSRMSPQPYLMPAFDRRLPPAFQALEQVAAGMLRP